MTLKHSSNKKCHCCGTQIQGEDLVAMNLKFYGRDTKNLECQECFMRNNNMTEMIGLRLLMGSKHRVVNYFERRELNARNSS